MRGWGKQIFKKRREEKRGGKQIFKKRGGQLGQGVGALKRGAGGGELEPPYEL